MELVITIELDNKAMKEGREAELSRMFGNILYQLAAGKTKGIIYDKDQNDQGDWGIQESLADMQPRK